MLNSPSVDVPETSRSERLEEAKSRQTFKQGTASHPDEPGRYIKAFYRQLLEQLPKPEHRACQGEAAADHGLP